MKTAITSAVVVIAVAFVAPNLAFGQAMQSKPEHTRANGSGETAHQQRVRQMAAEQAAYDQRRDARLRALPVEAAAHQKRVKVMATEEAAHQKRVEVRAGEDAAHQKRVQEQAAELAAHKKRIQR